MEFWSAALLCGILFSGLGVFLEVLAGLIFLRERREDMVLLIPLRGENAEKILRRSVRWMEGRRGVFPGRVAAVDCGLEKEVRERCRQYSAGSGIDWLDAEEFQRSLFANICTLDYTKE